MNLQKKLITVYVFYLSINEISSICEKINRELIKPCRCDLDRIICRGDINLDQVFEVLEKYLSADEKHFQELYLIDSDIIELKENQFRDITFGNIIIADCSQLKTFHKNAFDHMCKVTRYITLHHNPLLDVSIFNVLKKFTNLQQIVISGTDFDAIPSNAFDISQVSLRRVKISDSTIKIIENNAFSNLINISKILLIGSTVESFEENAFHFDTDSETRLSIAFDSELFESNPSSLKNSLLNINRPVEILFEQVDRVDYIDENIFSSFLGSNPKNRIKFEFLDCKDSRNNWFMNNTQLSLQMSEYTCSDNSYFYDVHERCPSPRLFKPCNCFGNIIYCWDKGVNGIDKLFEKLEKKLKSEHKHFRGMYFYSSDITELKENQFRDITFDVISINNCKQLKTIHENAFSANERNLLTFNLFSSPKLVFATGSLFDILSKFEKVWGITISDSNIETIPTNAFKSNQLNLQILNFEGTTIKTIEDNAFSSLKNLRILQLINTSIESIPEYGLHFNDNPEKEFDLHLISNNLISSSDFESKPLLTLNRPTVGIEIRNDKDPISYLKESFYQPFLKIRPENKISVNASLDCNDCRNVWLNKNPDLLPQIHNLKDSMPLTCSDGRFLNDTEIFTSC